MAVNAWELRPGELISPQGRHIPLREVLNWIMARHAGHQDIQTEKWRGWRIVQQYLVPPGRTMATGGIHINAIRSLVYFDEQEKRVTREKV